MLFNRLHTQAVQSTRLLQLVPLSLRIPIFGSIISLPVFQFTHSN